MLFSPQILEEDRAISHFSDRKQIDIIVVKHDVCVFGQPFQFFLGQRPGFFFGWGKVGIIFTEPEFSCVHFLLMRKCDQKWTTEDSKSGEKFSIGSHFCPIIREKDESFFCKNWSNFSTGFFCHNFFCKNRPNFSSDFFPKFF
jgi:hypothetical protein